MSCPHEHGFCDEPELPDFLDIMKSELTHLKNGRHAVGTVNDEALSALCGFPNFVLRFIWFKYGRCLLTHGCSPIDFMWTLSHMNLYDSDIVVGLLWGEKKTTFETTAKRNVRLLFDVLKEVRILLILFKQCSTFLTGLLLEDQRRRAIEAHSWARLHFRKCHLCCGCCGVSYRASS